MRSFRHYIFLHFLICTINAQENLIPNAGFEDYYDCEYSIFLDDIKTVIPHWQARVSSPRYFNWDCIGQPGNDQGTPINFAKSKEGVGYCVLVFSPKLITALPDFRQYLEVELKSSLVPGKDYFMSYWLTMPFIDQNPLAPYGVLFTDALANETITFNPPYPPIIADAHLEIDTVPNLEFGRWDRFTHCFTVDSAYSVMTLGIFVENARILNKENTKNGLTYLGYDDLLLVEIEREVRLDDYVDTICVGECVTLSSNHTLIPGTFVWDLPGSDVGSSTDSIVMVCYDQPGTYDVSLEVEHCTGRYDGYFSGAITVVEEVQHEKPEAVLKCYDELFSYALPREYETEWLDGYADRQREILDSGEYGYVLSNGYCHDTFLLQVSNYSVPTEEISNVRHCPGDSTFYLQQFYTEPGSYFDTVVGVHGCDSVYHELRLRYHPQRPVDIDGDLFYCRDKSTEIRIKGGIGELMWEDGLGSMERAFSEEGWYSFNYRDEFGCSYSDSIYIVERPVPEVFTRDMIDVGYVPNMPLDVDYLGSIEKYSWDPANVLSCGDCPFPGLIFPKSGLYTVEVENEWGCVAEGSLLVDFITYNTYVPNVINVGSDLPENRDFYLRSNVDFEYAIEIYNRWGGLVFRNDRAISNRPEDGWVPVSEDHLGVYVYKITYLELEEEKVVGGDVTVIK